MPKIVIVDTSALIDGRIIEVIKLGYLPQRIIVPRFVMMELQNIADAKESLRRNKGRRGLENLTSLKLLKKNLFQISNYDFKNIAKVDHKLLALCQKLNGQLLTTDYNLNRVALADNISVLNVNELAKNLHIDLLPSEYLEVKILHLGNLKNQGVGYLEDGTMVIVENARKLLGKKITAQVTRSMQTDAGRMYFAKLGD